MTFPEHITTGFDFDEAIWLAELCQRAHQLFTHADGVAVGALYNALYGNQEWQFVHAIGAAPRPARALIVQRANQQYAVVFWLSEPAKRTTAQSSTQTQSRPGDAHHGDIQVIEVTNLASEEEAKDAAAAPGRQPPLGADKAGSMAYPPLPGEVAPPALGVRVYGEWQETFAACQDEVERFFNERVRASTRQTAFAAPNEVEIYVTGHGAGGCLAALCALYLKRRWEARLDFPFFTFKMINFGSPKLGNKAFVDYYNKQMKGFSYRVQNLLDGAIYEPTVTAPFPYNLQLLLPGVDYIRHGEEYYMTYEAIGEAYTLAGIGKARNDFHLRGPFQSTLLLPFSHDSNGYKQMLLEARKLQETYWKPVQRVAATLDKQRQKLVTAFQKQGAELQKTVADVQIKVKQ